ncbi:hypothetical protein GW17_00043932 [Ensete ventricosum]|nr:hypothetical protein GW17_00043932 [Ensete ventricosum]
MTTTWYILQEYLKLCILLPRTKVFRSQLCLSQLSRPSSSIKCFSEIRCMCLEAPFVFGTMQDEEPMERHDPALASVRVMSLTSVQGKLRASAPYNQDLSLLDICPVRATFLFAFFPLEVSETTSPLDYFPLLNKLYIVLPPQMQLLDCDSPPIQPPLHPSRPSNMLNLLYFSLLETYPSHGEKKVSMLHGAKF